MILIQQLAPHGRWVIVPVLKRNIVASQPDGNDMFRKNAIHRKSFRLYLMRFIRVDVISGQLADAQAPADPGFFQRHAGCFIANPACHGRAVLLCKRQIVPRPFDRDFTCVQLQRFVVPFDPANRKSRLLFGQDNGGLL